LSRPDRARSATIVDVARLAGVSRMTVSRVINDGAKVREETRAAVLAAIRALNYEPNLAARNLVMAGELRIGVIYSNPSAAFMSDFLIGVFEEATSAGARLILMRGENGKAPTPRELESLLGSGVQGVVLAPPLGESAVVRDMLRAAHLPVAVVAAGRPPTDAINVRIDDRQASQAMAQHLLDLGHRRIGFIAGNPDQTASAVRLEGARAAIAAVEGAELVLAQGAFTYASGLRAAEQLLDADPPPTAIFASNDDMAAAAVSVAHRRHLDVPRDLTVVGFDDTTVATTLWPPLTTVRQPVRMMAAVALDRLMRALRSSEPSAEAFADYVLDHALIARESTAPPRPLGPPRLPIAGAKAHERSPHV
jgi:LacI family transcriptional regulator